MPFQIVSTQMSFRRWRCSKSWRKAINSRGRVPSGDAGEDGRQLGSTGLDGPASHQRGTWVRGY